jgi:hypothetical protein
MPESNAAAVANERKVMTQNRIVLALASLTLLAEPGLRLAAADDAVSIPFPTWGAFMGGGTARGYGIEAQGWRRGQEPRIVRHPDSPPFTMVRAIAGSGVLFGWWGSPVETTAGFYHPGSGTWRALPPYPGRTLNLGQQANNA